MSGPEHSGAPRAGAIAGTVGVLLGALFLELWALLVAVVGCGDSCDQNSGDWDDDSGAWQYEFQFIWATVGLGLAVLALVLAIRGRLRAAAFAVLATALTFAGWWVFVSS